ncbi:Uncharacterised protein [Mycobacterium tuberculosis]|nr:Uncharacterised protein [Mycobacterium tuberculosis]CNV56699.1 Uncharacterised protein [Mycobacterium tuberculosis]SGM51270.1 Uncharacterised protein [Mycobacterium tuberculosis]
MPAPRKAQPNAMSPRPNTVLSNVGKAAEYPMNDPKVPMYSSDMIQVSACRSDCHTGFTSALASVRLFINRNAHTAAATAKGTKNSPARDSATPLPATTMGGMIFCTTATPMLPPAAFRPSAQPLSFSG